MTKKEIQKVYSPPTIDTILNCLDGAGLVITDWDLIKKALKELGISKKSIVQY